MIGVIAGDIIGSVYESHNYNRTDFPLFDAFCRFTDDTVLTVAVADCLLSRGGLWRQVQGILQALSLQRLRGSVRPVCGI